MSAGAAEPVVVLLHGVGIGSARLEQIEGIDKAFTRSPFFGSRQIEAYLRRETRTTSVRVVRA